MTALTLDLLHLDRTVAVGERVVVALARPDRIRGQGWVLSEPEAHLVTDPPPVIDLPATTDLESGSLYVTWWPGVRGFTFSLGTEAERLSTLPLTPLPAENAPAGISLLDIRDTPISYRGEAGRALTVLDDETGVGFTDVVTSTEVQALRSEAEKATRDVTRLTEQVETLEDLEAGDVSALAATVHQNERILDAVTEGGDGDMSPLTAIDLVARATQTAQDRIQRIVWGVDLDADPMPGTLEANVEQLSHLGDWRRVHTNNAANLSATLTAQALSDRPLIIVVVADIGAPHNVTDGDILYVPPRTDDFLWLFNMGDGSGGAAFDPSPLLARLDAIETDGWATMRRIGDQAISTDKIVWGNVIARHLAVDSVTTTKIADAAVTGAKIPNDQILARHIPANEIGRSEIAGAAIGGAEVEHGSLPETKLDAAARQKLNASGVSIDAVRSEFRPWIDIEPGQYSRLAGPQDFHMVIGGVPASGYPNTDGIDIVARGILLHREAWTPATGNRVIDWTIDATEDANLARNIPANQDSVLIELHFTESGTRTLQVTRELPVGISRRVLQAAVAGGDSAGTNRIVLPANYADYHHLSLGIWEGGQDAVSVEDVPVPVLAANPAMNIRDQTSARQNLVLTWNRSTRTLSTTNPDRFIYAALER